MDTLYTSGRYLETTRTWHAEDSPWKARQILELVGGHRLDPRTIAEIGCGAGAILDELSHKDYFSRARFAGYDISQDAIELARQRTSGNLRFVHGDLLSETNADHFDLLLVIDVFEHVADYLGFLERCRRKAKYKIFHVPLDIHVSSVLRNAFIRGRYTVGHLHYFTAESAIATLKDAGYEIVDYRYTNVATGLFKQHPSVKKAIANVPRWLLSTCSVPFTARVFGGYSLLVLAQ
ncbi:MAG TPA: methyltransferase domain-containing protein [Candidatus Binatia bacterium]|jgi:SAM-dependent methyltransferase